MAILAAVFSCNIAVAWSQAGHNPQPRAAFEYSDKYIKNTEFVDGRIRGYIDVDLDDQVRRIWTHQAMRLVCHDDDDVRHEAWLIPGSTVQPITLDTFIILDMKPGQCYLGAEFAFVGDNNVYVDYKVVFLAGQRGQLRRFEPK